MMLKLVKKILCFTISAILMINIYSGKGIIVQAEDNETIIYQYLRNDLQLNEAGASGVLSNLFFESSFNPNASSPGGSYYGIVQWGGGRKTNLENYAASLGVDRSDLKAQLDFMKQELNMAYYRSVYNDLLSVDNTADGAAQAADIFKRRYEVASDPKDRTQKARDFFAKYYVAPTPTPTPSPVPTPVPSST
ncbi:phage tail tip lysozyme, partial [Solobacterium sp.]|uniref:phage tail tip lysozyme n=1 Tax=Solobacterium sp. TaxID=2060878 RepID=UPI001CAE7643